MAESKRKMTSLFGYLWSRSECRTQRKYQRKTNPESEMKHYRSVCSRCYRAMATENTLGHYLAKIALHQVALKYTLLNLTAFYSSVVRSVPVGFTNIIIIIISQPSIYIDGWLYGMRMTSGVCNVLVLSQNDSTYHHSVFTT